MKLFLMAILSLIFIPADITFAEDTAQTSQDMKAYTVAILPFSSSQGDFENLSTDVPLLMNAFMSASPSVMLVERAEIDKALSEIELGKSGTVDPDTAAKVGYLTAAQVLITGRVFPVQKELMIVAKIIGVETGRTYGEVVELPLQGNIKDAVQELSDKVATVVEEKGATLIAVDKKEDILAKLKPLISDTKTLPSVFVHIEETKNEPSSTSTSAQTELTWILQNLGFTIIDELASNKKADIEITGTSQSAFALRKGNLVSAKSSVDIKVMRNTDSNVLLVDREQAVSVDLSFEMASKESQAKAASALAERLVKTLTTKQ